MQLKSSSDCTRAVVVSTLVEAWEIVKSGLVKDGTVDDVNMGTSDLIHNGNIHNCADPVWVASGPEQTR